MDTQNIRSHLLKGRLSKWTLTLSFLIGRSCYTYIMDMQNGRSIREGYGMIPCTAGPAISFKCRRKRIGLPPVSGISPVPFHAWRMRHRKKRRRIPKEMRRPEAFRGTLGSEDGAELRQKVPGEETVLDALPERTFAPTLCRAYVSLMPGAAQSSTTRCSLSSRAAWR